MPNAPCARLTKFINPSVTVKPTDRTKSSIPKAKPSNRTMASWLITVLSIRQLSLARTLLCRSVERVLHVRDLFNDDVLKLVADLLHLADIDRLDDIAGLGVDRHRSARALP